LLAFGLCAALFCVLAYRGTKLYERQHIALTRLQVKPHQKSPFDFPRPPHIVDTPPEQRAVYVIKTPAIAEPILKWFAPEKCLYDIAELGVWELHYTQDMVESLEQLTTTRKLGICAGDLSSDQIASIISAMPYLRSLDIASTETDDPAWTFALENLRRLETLNLEGLRNIRALSARKLPKSLEHLVLGGTDIDELPVEFVRQLDGLKSLDLSYTEVTDETVQRLKHLRNLEWLDLSEIRVTDQGVLALAGASRIENLFLNGTRVTDRGMKVLPQLPALRRVDLESTRVSDDALEYLKSCEHLSEVSLRFTNTTSEGIAHLKKALPDCEIHWEGETDQPRGQAGSRY